MPGVINDRMKPLLTRYLRFLAEEGSDLAVDVLVRDDGSGWGWEERDGFQEALRRST